MLWTTPGRSNTGRPGVRWMKGIQGEKYRDFGWIENNGSWKSKDVSETKKATYAQCKWIPPFISQSLLLSSRKT
jgi:hypothetical protein